jgi:hypothetical protein
LVSALLLLVWSLVSSLPGVNLPLRGLRGAHLAVNGRMRKECDKAATGEAFVSPASLCYCIAASLAED